MSVMSSTAGTSSRPAARASSIRAWSRRARSVQPSSRSPLARTASTRRRRHRGGCIDRVADRAQRQSIEHVVGPGHDVASLVVPGGHRPATDSATEPDQDIIEVDPRREANTGVAVGAIELGHHHEPLASERVGVGQPRPLTRAEQEPARVRFASGPTGRG